MHFLALPHANAAPHGLLTYCVEDSSMTIKVRCVHTFNWRGAGEQKSPHKEMPGWNEKLASDSEATVRSRWAFPLLSCLSLCACAFTEDFTLFPVPEHS